MSAEIKVAQLCKLRTQERKLQTCARAAAVTGRRYSKFKARKSSRGSSKLQLPNDVTNLRRYCSRALSIFHSRHAKNSSVKENESAFSSSSMVAACSASHLYSAASTAAPRTLRNPCIFVFTSSRNIRSG